MNNFFRFLLTASFLVVSINSYAQTIYSKAFGDKNSPPVIFIHGGPSGNSVLFEGTTAQKLAGKGFYVIVYDRRGEGRSSDLNAKLTYEEAFNDLNGIYKKYGLKKASLIGFSFGGLVTIQYAEKYPQNINAIVLTSALISQQQTYDHILREVKKIYTQKGDVDKLRKVSQIESLDKNTANYRKECFDIASENGFFNVAQPDEEARIIRKEYETSGFDKNDVRNKNAPAIFYQNEQRKNIDVMPLLKELKKGKMKIYALYGRQDGIFSSLQIRNLKLLTGENNFRFLDQASHYLFVDQQKQFLDHVAKWVSN
jgi:proline iminopeptidase